MNKKYTLGHCRGIGATLGFLMFFAVTSLAVAASATINTFANSFIPAGGGQVTLSQPTGVATDSAGNVYVADTGNCVVWEFPAGGQQPFAVAGQRGVCTGSYASANPTLNSLNHPTDVAACNGTVYILDTATAAQGATGLHSVKGGVFSTVVLHYTATRNIVGVAQPQAIACDNAGDLYVQSTYNAGDTNGPSYTLDTLTAGGITLNVGQEFDFVYQGVALDANGNVYTTRSQAGGLGSFTTIAKFTLASGAPNFVWDETVLTLSRYLNGPTRIALDPQGNFYVNEAAPVAAGSPFGPTVYVSEISPSGTVSILAGNGTPGFSGDGGPPLSAEFDNVNAIAPGATIYVADTGNNRVRQFYSATASLPETDKIPNFSLQTAVNPTTQTLYVAVSRGNYTVGGPVYDVVAYSTVDDTVAANIPVAGGVSYLAVDTLNNVIYASSVQAGTVTVIDGATNTVDATIPVGISPLGIAVDPALNIAYVSNSEDTHISVIHGPVRTSGVITAPAYSLPAENIGGILPLGAIGVDTNSHTVYAIVAGPSVLGTVTYALAIIKGGAVTNTVSYLLDSTSTNIAANALAVDQRSGLVVIADTADQSVTVYNPQSGALQGFGQVFYPNNIAMDSVNEIAYASTGYGNISQINLVGGGQSVVNVPAFPATSGQNCGFSGTAVAVDPTQVEAYFTTCDATNGAVLTLWNAALHRAVSTFSLGSFNSGVGDFAVTVDPSRHVAYASNSIGTGEIDVFNGPAAPATPQLTLSVNGGAAQPLNAAASVAFGSIAVGQSSAAKSFTVTDTGAAAADVPSPVILGGNFTNTGSTCAEGVLLSAGGGTCTTTVSFAPTKNTALTAGLAFFDNERDTPQLVGLTGTGTGTHFLTISPSTVPAGYVGLPYAPSGLPVQFSATNASGFASVNICSTQTGPTTSPPDTSSCCPDSSVSIGQNTSCPAGLLPPGVNWYEPDLSAPTGSITTTGTYSFSVVATDSSGDYGWTNYTLTINPMFSVLLSLSAPSVTGGSSVNVTVTLNEPAPAGGSFIFINSSNPGFANSTVVTVNAGLTTGTATVATHAVTALQPVTLTGSYDGSSASVTLLVAPPSAPPPGSISLVESISVGDTLTFPDLVDAESIAVTDSVALSATVPNVVGDSNGTADSILSSAGLTIGTVTYVNSTTVPAGTVISQSPGSTSAETAGEAINLVISSGPPAAASLTVSETIAVTDSVGLSVSVPNVVNEPQDTATTNLQSEGFNVGTVASQVSSAVAAGLVISQSPAAGSLAVSGSSVNLVVSSGPPHVVIGLKPGRGGVVITRSSQGLSVALALQNTGNVTATTVLETSATLNGVAQSAAVSPLTALAPGASGTFVLAFPVSAGIAGAVVPLTVNGSCTAPLPATCGIWHVNIRGIALP